MKCKKKYSDANKSNIMLHANVCCLSISILFLFLFFPLLNYAQQEQDYDETLVLLSVDKIGGGDIPAAIRGMELFLPVSDLFDFLGIYNKSSYSLDTISGFFLNQDAKYLIDAVNNKIKFKGKSISLDPGDIIKTPAALYLKSNYFGSVFGLVCTFNFRSLSVVLKPTMELPAIRQMRLEKMRENKQQLKGELEADTTYHRTNPFFHFGMADWSVISTQQYNGRSDNRLYLALGSVIAGGEADVALNYNAGEAFTERQQYYLWKYVNNDFSPLRQAMAGKIYTHSTSSIYAPVLGVQLTNTPSVYRRSFGTYNLSDYTEPGWTVELYVNNVLVDFVKADARGFFTFKVPLVYGNSNVKLRFYGPWGEEKSKEQNISVPFNFLPPGQAEYTLSGGLVEDKLNGRFGRANLNYGMAKWITMGAGVEYLSTVSSGATSNTWVVLPAGFDDYVLLLGLVREIHLLTVQIVKAPCDLAGQLHMGDLVFTDRHQACLVNEDVGALQYGIAEKAVGIQVFFPQLLLHILVRRYPLQPAQWRKHGQQQVQFGVLHDPRLDEQLGLPWD